MSRRSVVSRARLGAVLGFVVLVAPIAVSTQSAPGGAAYKTPKTYWGDPDIMGVWSNATVTPLERPADLAGKEFLTEQEALEREKQIAATRVDAPPRAGDPGTYNQIWFDRGTKVAATRRTSLIVDPPDGRIPAYTPEAEQRVKAAGAARRDRLEGRAPFLHWTDLDTGERCITDGLPMLPYAYNNNYRISQTPGWVMIFSEMFHHTRAIPTDGRPHVGSSIRQWLGDSRGRWEGDTLVVETKNFADKVEGTGNARGAGSNMTLTEKFKRVSADTVLYEFTINDPKTFTKPWTAQIPMTTDQSAQGAAVGNMYEYACHEGNQAMINVLGGGANQTSGGAGR